MKQAYINSCLLDGNEYMQPQEGVAVLVDGDKIEDIVDAYGFDKTEYEIIDLAGKWMLPGLINLHVHMPASGKPPKSDKPKDYKRLIGLATKLAPVMAFYSKTEERFARYELFSGVTTLRAVGGVKAMDSKLRDRINSGKAIGPRILAANSAISVPGGHFAGSLGTETKTPEEARADVKRIAADGIDLLKLMVTGGVMDATEEGEPGKLRMSPEIVKAACDAAHEMGLPVAAHVESTEGLQVALENGVDTIEHGAKPTDEIIALFKSRGAADVCTISPALPYAFMDRKVSCATEVAQKNGMAVLDGIIACARACLANGIPVGLGTDTGCPFITHYDMWRELCHFQKYCHVSALFAIYTATKRNAEIAGISDITGTIERGKSADFIVVGENPLEDLTVLRRLDMVVARGKRYCDLKIDKNERIGRELDKLMESEDELPCRVLVIQPQNS